MMNLVDIHPYMNLRRKASSQYYNIGHPIYINTIFSLYIVYTTLTKEVNNMGYGCCETGFHRARRFLTKEERISLLKEYKNNLEKETQGVVEKIKELEAS